MKCKFCGARSTNNEKNCPECGNPIKNESVPVTIPDADPETSETFIYSKHLLWPTLLRFIGGIILIIVVVFSFRDIKYSFMLEEAILTALFCGGLALYLFFRGISGLIQEKNCFVCITPERIYGKIPTGLFDAEEIDIPLADIVAVNETYRSYRFFSSSDLKIVTKQNEIEINASSGDLLTKIGKSLTKYIKKYK